MLVVDDEPTLTDLLSMALRYEGWDVRTAPDGLSAVRAAREFRPDAVVLDIMLPDLSGLEVLHRLRADATDVPVLFLTAMDATEDRIAGLTAGGDDYVTKPFSLEELVARLRNLMRRTHVLVQPPESHLVVGDLVLDEDSHEVTRAGRPALADGHGVRAAALSHAQPASRALEGADPRPRLELRLRRAGQRRRALHLLPPQEGGRRARADDPHDAWGGLRPQAGGMSGRPTVFTVSRWSLRARLVVGMLALLAVMGVIIGVVSVVALDKFLMHRLDQQVVAASLRSNDVYANPDPVAVGRPGNDDGETATTTASTTRRSS